MCIRDRDIYVTDWYDYTVTEQYANIGVGWEFDFPYIERLYSNTTGGQGNQDLSLIHI